MEAKISAMEAEISALKALLEKAGDEPTPKRGTFADCRLLRLGVSICGSNDMANACVQGAMGYVCVCMNTCSKTFPRTAVQSPHLFPCRTTSPQKQHQQER